MKKLGVFFFASKTSCLMEGVDILMLIYIVMYHDGTWGTNGDKIVGVFDTLDQAKKLVEYIEEIKDFDDELTGSYAYTEECPLNYAAEDSFIKLLG